MILISEPLFFSTLIYLVLKHNLSNTGYSWASKLTCCISSTNPVICGIFTTTHLITKHLYVFIQYVFIYMFSLCIYWYISIHSVCIHMYLFIHYVFICIYSFIMYSYISIYKYSHSRSLTSHFCNICCIFATLKNLLRLCNFCGTYATFVVFIQQIGRDTPSSPNNFKFRLIDRWERIWENLLFTRAILGAGRDLRLYFSYTIDIHRKVCYNITID